MSQPNLAAYQRIADTIRRRIQSGQLRPGQRAPSTRALARKWKVALATAAHALSTLKAEGLLRSVPRVGTLVASSALTPEPSGVPRELSRQRIVEAAIAIADGEGLATLSLRGVASRLDAPVTSLYRHVNGKEELLLAMTEAVIAEELLPATPPPGWRPQLELAARLHWRVLRRHPWLARLMSITRPRPLPRVIAHANWVLRALDGHGLDANLRMHLHIILHAFMQGVAVNLETEADATSETGMTDSDWMDTQLEGFEELAKSGHYPAFAAILGELDDGFDLDLDHLFELGLKLTLDGFAPLLTLTAAIAADR
jgi:DNA-binding transcriptional regulator YhcF (GntR family)